MEETFDVQVGANIARLREGRSQQWLADEMRKRGWKWSQATVWSVESGSRPVRFGEAYDLTTLLDASFGTLLGHAGDIRYRQKVERDYREARLAVIAAFRAYDQQRDLMLKIRETHPSSIGGVQLEDLGLLVAEYLKGALDEDGNPGITMHVDWDAVRESRAESGE